jgi:hypothetical protein
MRVPLYGNHCGPGHGTPDDPAENQVDEACKEHDAGYATNGYFDLGSDLELMDRQLDLIESGRLDARQTVVAGAIVGVFAALLPVSAAVSGVRKLLDSTELLGLDLPRLPLIG